MSDYSLIVIGAALANNLLLVQFLGLCPALGTSRALSTAAMLALATSCVLTVSTALNHLVYAYLLRPFDLVYLRTLAFVLVIAALAPVTERALRRTRALWPELPGGLTPLIIVNSALLGVALLNAQAARGFIESVLYGFGGALGLSLVTMLFAALRERIATADVPAPFTGNPVSLITLGLMSLAFMGFAGLAG